MKKIAVIYGAIAGVIIIGTMTIGYAISEPGEVGASQFVGFGIMFIAFSLIFFGIKRFRDRDLGGVIRFWPAFGLGCAIAGVAALVYIAGWEMYLAATDYSFIDVYTKSLIEAKVDAGVTGEELAKFTDYMEVMKARYANPFYRVPMTFTEIFPVGLIVSLISAVILRKPHILPAR